MLSPLLPEVRPELPRLGFETPQTEKKRQAKDAKADKTAAVATVAMAAPAATAAMASPAVPAELTAPVRRKSARKAKAPAAVTEAAELEEDVAMQEAAASALFSKPGQGAEDDVDSEEDRSASEDGDESFDPALKAARLKGSFSFPADAEEGDAPADAGEGDADSKEVKMTGDEVSAELAKLLLRRPPSEEKVVQITKFSGFLLKQSNMNPDFKVLFELPAFKGAKLVVVSEDGSGLYVQTMQRLYSGGHSQGKIKSHFRGQGGQAGGESSALLQVDRLRRV